MKKINKKQIAKKELRNASVLAVAGPVHSRQLEFAQVLFFLSHVYHPSMFATISSRVSLTDQTNATCDRYELTLKLLFAKYNDGPPTSLEISEGSRSLLKEIKKHCEVQYIELAEKLEDLGFGNVKDSD